MWLNVRYKEDPSLEKNKWGTRTAQKKSAGTKVDMVSQI